MYRSEMSGVRKIDSETGFEDSGPCLSLLLVHPIYTSAEQQTCKPVN